MSSPEQMSPDDEPIEARARELLDLIDRVRLLKQAETPNDRETFPSFPQTNVEPGARVGRFELIELIGHGGFGNVYLAFDPDLNRNIALKLPRGSLTPQRRSRFLREGRAAASLTHPAIVPIFEAGQLGDQLYIASQFVPGQTLAEHLKGNQVAPREAAQIVRCLAEGLCHAHQRGVLHRDVKPTNILLPDNSQSRTDPLDSCALLIDFGLAKDQSEFDHQTQSGMLIGTPSYMPPEQLTRDQEVTSSGDVYSLGAVLYEMLTGRPPLEASTLVETLDLVRHKVPQNPTVINRSIPRDLEAICMRCLEKSPRDRYGDCFELASDLGRFLSGDTVTARKPSVVARGLRWYRKNWSVATLGLALMMTLLVGAIVTYNLYLDSQRNLQQARQNYQRSERAVDTLLTEVGEQLAQVPGAQVSRRRILLDALRYFDEVIAVDSNDASVGFKRADALLNVAEIQNHLGDPDKAISANKLAIKLLDGLHRSEQQPVGLAKLANAHSRLAHFYTQSREFDDALSHTDDALELWHEVEIEPRARSLEVQRMHVASLFAAAVLFTKRKQSKKSIELYEQIIDQYSEPALVSADKTLTWQIARSYNNLGNRYREIDSQQRFRDCVFEANQILSQLIEQYPEDYILLASFSHNLFACGDAVASPKSIEYFDQSLATSARVMNAFPSVPKYANDHGLLLAEVGRRVNGLGRPADALVNFVEAYKIQQQLAESYPGNVAYQRNLGVTAAIVGKLKQALGSAAESISYFQMAVKISSTEFERDPESSSKRARFFARYKSLLLALVSANDMEGFALALPLSRSDKLSTEQQFELATIGSRAYQDWLKVVNSSPDVLDQIADETIRLLSQCIQDPDFDVAKRLDKSQWNPIRDDSRFQRLLDGR